MADQVKSAVKALMQVPMVRSLLCVTVGLILGYMAFSLWHAELLFSLEGQRSIGVVEQYSPTKASTGHANLTYQANGQTVEAQMSTFLYTLKPGDSLPILYRSEAPHLVRPDSPWRRFLVPVLASLIPALCFIFGVTWGLEDFPRLYSAVEYPHSTDGNPVEPSGLPLDPSAPLKVGSRVLAYEQNRWWRAEVVEMQGDTARIHFPGWDPHWDKNVPTSELQMELADLQQPGAPSSRGAAE
jgi:hypothetical protein